MDWFAVSLYCAVVQLVLTDAVYWRLSGAVQTNFCPCICRLFSVILLLQCFREVHQCCAVPHPMSHNRFSLSVDRFFL